MYNDKTILAIIPARGGSKGLPGKNIKNLLGKPLIQWTIDIAKKSKYLDRIMVSTDSQEIADVSKQAGAEVPFLRPAHLATDTATTFDAVAHTINHYKENEKIEYDYIILLEPTSPLREDDDIDNMIEKLLSNPEKYDSLVSVGEVGEHPSIMKKISQGKFVINYCESLEMKTRRQDNDAAYFPYCVGYLVKKDALLREKTFYTKKNTFWEIKRYQCYEIDDLYDFLAIENIMRYEWNK
ncbi:acylneuraminate cytidylyltransferase family protein [bacterium SCSIO 12643]|nr:acylneuraminate cytidylyltransferase family protein [bacterium SCSIO 12643]